MHSPKPWLIMSINLLVKYHFEKSGLKEPTKHPDLGTSHSQTFWTALKSRLFDKEYRVFLEKLEKLTILMNFCKCSTTFTSIKNELGFNILHDFVIENMQWESKVKTRHVSDQRWHQCYSDGIVGKRPKSLIENHQSRQSLKMALEPMRHLRLAWSVHISAIQ